MIRRGSGLPRHAGTRFHFDVAVLSRRQRGGLGEVAEHGDGGVEGVRALDGRQMTPFSGCPAKAIAASTCGPKAMLVERIRACNTRPIAPDAISSRACKPMAAWTPAACAALANTSDSARSRPSGYSQQTCFPAASAPSRSV